jgi:acylphosphatase
MTTPKTVLTKHLIIFGHVQGVGYRAWAEFMARQMNLTGWTRNRRNDRSVEIVVTGQEEDVERFIKACYKGPASAKVQEVSIMDGFAEEVSGFEIRDTV